MEHTVRILAMLNESANIKHLIVEKPEGYTFLPGQSAMIYATGSPELVRPLSFASTIEAPNLEFYIKKYDNHHGFSLLISELVPGETLVISEPFGNLGFQGPGYFIAGGTGITPFLSIFRQLKEEGALAGNELFYSNQASEDIIAEKELRSAFGRDAVFFLSRERKLGYEGKLIDGNYLKAQKLTTKKYFYICGPYKMVQVIKDTLTQIGVPEEKIIYEKAQLPEKKQAAA